MNDLNKTDNRTAAELRLKEQEAEEQIEVLKQALAVAVGCEQTSRNEANRLRAELTAALARLKGENPNELNKVYKDELLEQLRIERDAALARAEVLNAAEEALEGRHPSVVGACTEYRLSEDELPDEFDSEDYCLHKAVASLLRQRDREAKRAEAAESKVKELEAKCDASERACAEKDWALVRGSFLGPKQDAILRHALSPACGKGYKSPAEVREMLPYLHHLDSCHMPAAPCTCGLEALVKEAK